MQIRINSGSLKGRIIRLQNEAEIDIRPTKDIIRQSVINSLQNRILDADCADICAGSGAFGFELLSRGAKKVMFVDNNSRRTAALAEHAQQFNVLDETIIRKMDMVDFIRTCKDTFDIVIADPPYQFVLGKHLLNTMIQLLSHKGVLVYEHGSETLVEEDADCLYCVEKQKKFGQSTVSFLLRKEIP